MAEYFEVGRVGVGAEPEELVSAWMQNLHTFEKAHPRVFRKVVESILTYTGEKDLTDGLSALARELIERRKKSKNLRSVKIASTYKKYLYYYYGSAVKLYLDGLVAYAPRTMFDGGFVIHEGEEVA